MVIPIVKVTAPPEVPQKSEPDAERFEKDERYTIFEPPSPRPPVIVSNAPARVNRQRASLSGSGGLAPKPFFTQVLPSTTNRQHHRLVLFAALLLLVFIGVLVLAYIANKY
jgi:hypothetical protein